MTKQRPQVVPLKTRPDITPDWTATESAILENKIYGSIRQRVMLDSAGQALYDFPQFIEPGGAACLPISVDKRIALEHIFRPGALVDCPQGEFPDFRAPEDFGRLMWEAPQGFRNLDETVEATAVRELAEETGLQVQQLQFVGNVFTNSANFPVPMSLFIAQVTGDPRPQASENIDEISWFDSASAWSMVRSGEICCAMTLALLAHAHARRLLD